MENKEWKFNRENILLLLRERQELLNNKHLSEVNKKNIQGMINNLYQILNVIDDTCDNPFNDRKMNILKIKKVILNKMALDYKNTDHEFIDFVCDFFKASDTSYYYTTKKYNEFNEPDDVINKSIEVYKEFAPELLSDAYKIINNPVNLINFSDKYKIGSKCLYDPILALPFLEIEKINKVPHSFIHELQHGIEMINNYQNLNFYSETGAILFEMLYIDKMIEQDENNAYTLYFNRLSSFRIDYLSSYFKVLKIFSKNNFNVSTSQFLKVLQYNHLALKNRISSLILDEDTTHCITYLVSFLKAIELREYFYQDKKYGLRILKSILESNDKDIRGSYLLAAINLDNYYNEIKHKAKTYCFC